MTVRELIQKAKIQEAIDKLFKEHMFKDTYNSIILLSGRFTKLEKDKRLGILSNENYNQNYNAIVKAILYYCQGNNNDNEKLINKKDKTSMEDELLDIIKNNKRRRVAISDQAREVLKEYRGYNDKKSENSSYDPSNRRFKAIVLSFESLRDKLKENKLDSIEEITIKVNTFLSEPIPSYDNLSKAYKLCHGRGLSNDWIESQLIATPEDDETRITIAEKLEEYTSRIAIK